MISDIKGSGRFDQLDVVLATDLADVLEKQRSVTKVCTCERWAIRTGAVRSNLVESNTRMTCRALAMTPSHLYLAEIEIEKRAIVIDRRSAQSPRNRP